MPNQEFIVQRTEILPPLKIVLSDDVPETVLRAAAALEAGELQLAFELTESIGAVDVSNGNATLIRLMSLFLQERYEQIVILLAQLRAAPTPFTALMKGVSLAELGRRDEAIPQLICTIVAASGAHVRSTTAMSDQLLAAFSALVRPGGITFGEPIVGAAGRALSRLEYWEFDSEAHSALIALICQCLVFSPKVTATQVVDAFGFFGLFESAWPDRQDQVFKSVVLPALILLGTAGKFEEALEIEGYIYDSYVKRRETAEHFGFVYNRLAPIFAAMGRAFGSRLPPLPPIERQGKFAVAFIVPNLVYLAHVSTLLDILECVMARADRRINPTLVGFLPPDARVANRCAALGIPVASIDDGKADWLSRLAGIREYLSREAFAAAVWISVAPLCSFAMGMKLAPVQIFFAMKYHGLSVPEIDGYLTGGAIGEPMKSIEGRQWLTGPPPFRNLFDPGASEMALQIKSKLGSGRVLLGSFGREEKLNNPIFIDCICRLLQAHPNVLFLWTGRQKLPAIQRRFEAAGVAPRCVFIGWVNTLVYAQVIDIFVDSFPFPCGLTILQAMAAGKATVFYASREAMETGIPMLIEPLFSGVAGSADQRRRTAEILAPRGRRLFLLAQDTSQYIAYASELIESPGLRTEAGEAMRSFLNEFLTDTVACGKQHEDNILQIIAAKIAEALPAP